MRTITRAFAVLECFTAVRPKLSLQDIASQLRLAKSTTFRLVRTLRSLGYLIELEEKKYSLSFKVLSLSGVVTSSLGIQQVARPVLLKMAQSCGEGVTLHTLRGGARVCIDAVNPPPRINQPGDHEPLGLGAASLVLMACGDEENLKTILPVGARTTRCSQSELASILATVRKQGYAVSHGGNVQGLTGISAPIYGAFTGGLYSVSIVLPTRRACGRVAALTKLTREGAGDISSRMGS